MKRVMVLCLQHDRDETLRALRSLGVLHVVPVHAPEGPGVEEARHQLERIHQAREHLHPRDGGAPSARPPEETVRAIEANVHRTKALGDEKDSLEMECRRWAPFGEFDPHTVAELEKAGWCIQCYQAPAGTGFDLPDTAVQTVLQTGKKEEFGVVASHGPCAIEADVLPVPAQSPDAMRRRLEAIDRERKELAEELEALGTECAALQEHALAAEDELVITETRGGMGEADPVSYLRGYCPRESVAPIQAEAARLGWGVVVADVRPDDAAPTLIRTPKWVRPIRAVFDFIGVTPGYDEVDISALFLLFFSLFFAMIVGDAGYGALFLGMTLAGMKMFPRVPGNIYRLLLIMSCGTIVYGLLTGNIFGLPALPAPLAALQLDWMTGANADRNLMLLCFLIGAIHITLAHGWNLIRQFPHPSFLAQLGWICTTWAMFFVARLMVLNHPWPVMMTSILIAGVILIAVFMTPMRRLKAEWFHHVMLPLNLIGNFVDVVSYVRLYAVGMATFAVASSFNEMGGALFGSIPGTLAGALVIFFGHTLNIMLASMGVLVHGVRLNTLEFATHLGLQWSGVPFEPFARKSQTNRKET